MRYDRWWEEIRADVTTVCCLGRFYWNELKLRLKLLKLRWEVLKLRVRLYWNELKLHRAERRLATLEGPPDRDLQGPDQAR